MTSQHTTRRLCAAVFLLVAAAISGCDTSDAPVDGPPADAYAPQPDSAIAADAGSDAAAPAPTVNFYIETASGKELQGNVSLKSLQPTDDKYDVDPGFQIDVFVETENVADGAKVTVTVDGSVAGSGTIAANGAKIAKVTLPCAKNDAQKAIKVEVDASGTVLDKSKAVTLGCGDACEAKITAPDGCLTADADPGTDGFQAAFEVSSSTPGCDTAWIEVTEDIAKGKVKSQEVKLQNGKATISVKLGNDATGLVAAESKVKAHVKSSSNADQPAGVSEEIVVKITTEKPVIDIVTPPAGKLTLADDTDANKQGLQVVLKGSVTTLTVSDIDKIAVTVDGAAVGTATADTKGVFSQSLEFKASKTYNVTVSAENSCGLKSSKDVAYQVFVDQATLLISQPKPKSVLLAKNDADKTTASVYDTQFAVALQDVQAGATIGVYCRPNTVGASFSTTPVGTALVTAGAQGLAIPVKLNIDDLTTSVVCVARDDGANAAESPAVAFQIGLPAPCLKLTLPTPNVVTNAADLALAVTANNLAGAGLNARIDIKGGATFFDDEVGKITNNSLSAKIALSVGKPPVPFPDGDYTLTVSATDGFGNKASDSSCSDLVRGFKVDRTPPVVSIAAPVTATLDPLVNPDSAPNEKGYQTNVVVTIGGEPVTDSIEVCLKVNQFEPPCIKSAPNATQVTFSGIPLGSGDNVIAVTATDKVGNKTAKPVTKIVKLITDAVKVDLVSPTGDTAVAQSSLTMQVKVSKDGKPINKADGVVFVNGAADATVAVTENGGGKYSASITNLKPGPNTIFFVAFPDKVNEGVSPKITVTYKTTKPTIGITSPADGALLSGTAAACVAGATDCVLKSFKAATTNAADGSSVEISADCGAGKPITATGTVTANSLELVNTLTLPNDSTCKISATVTDEAGQKATSKVVTVTVDRTAPTIVSMSSPSKDKLFAADDLDKAVNGVQVALTLRACDLPASSDITCTVTDDKKQVVATLKSKPHGEISKACGNVAFGVVTLPDGEAIKLSCTTADGAGNQASFSKTLLVVAQQPDARLTFPLYLPNKSCSKQADCAPLGICVSGKCATGWNQTTVKEFKAAILGVGNGTSVRLCTTGPTAAGAAACSEKGYKVVTTGKTVNSNITFEVPSMLDGNHTLTVEAEDPTKPGKYFNSANSVGSPAAAKYRYVYLDTVAPAVLAVLPPTISGVPAGCLAKASQNKDDLSAGGTFTFAARANEASNIALVADGKTLGTGLAEKDKVTGITVNVAQEGSLSLVAVATDLVGNQSSPFKVKTGKSTEDHTFNVNTVPPVGKFLSPLKSPLLAGDSRDVIIESKNDDVDGQRVVLKDSAGKAFAPELKLAKGVVTYKHADYKALSDGSHQLTAEVFDTCGNSHVFNTNPKTIVVDTQAPTVTLSAPLASANFADGDDADKSVGGYQVKVSFGTNGAKSYKLELGTDCDAQFKSCKFYVAQTDTAVTKPGGNEPDRFITIPFGKTTNYSIKVTATDENGNSSIAENGFTVKLSGCLVALTGLPGNGVANTQNCATKGSNCSSVNFDLQAEFLGPCGSVDTVRLFKDSTQLASVKPVGSKASFKATLNDGEDVKLEARLFAGGSQTGSSGPTKLTVDLSNPVVNFVAADVGGFQTAASGSTPLWGASKDQDIAKNDFQFTARITISDKSIQGGKLTKLEATVDGATTDITGSVKLPVTFATSALQTIDFKQGTVRNDKTTVVTATAEDTNGNVGTAQFTVTVDTVAPGKLTLAALQDADLNPRRPYAKLNFTAVADNGTAGAAATAYEVRYSRSAISSDADFDKACDAASLTASAIAQPKAAGQADSVMVEGPDPRAHDDACKFAPLTDNGAGSFFFAVRAVDKAGNKGAISNVVSTTKLRLRYAKVVGKDAPTNASKVMRYVGAVGDINGDGKDDFAVGRGKGEDYCIVYGTSDSSLSIADIELSGTSGATHTCFGLKYRSGRKPIRGIDVNGDGVDDLVLDVGTSNSAKAEIRVHLGEKGKAITLTPALTITNIASFNTVSAMGHAGNFNGDKSTSGNALDDFAFRVLPDATVTYNRVIIVPGSESWSTSNPKTIDLGKQADREANNIATVHLVNPTQFSNFGTSITTVGNVLPDGDGSGTQYDDLAIGQPYTPQQVVILKGQPLNKEVVFALTPSIPTTGQTEADKKTVRIAALGTGANNFAWPAKVDFDGDKTPDLAVLHRITTGQPTMYWIRGKDVATYLGKQVTLAGTPVKAGSAITKHAMGYATPVWANSLRPLGNFFDVTGGGVALAWTRPKWGPGGYTTATIAAPFTRPDTGVKDTGNYGVSDLVFKDPFTPTSTNFGNADCHDAGDINGDGYPDLIVGSSTGYAVIVY